MRLLLSVMLAIMVGEPQATAHSPDLLTVAERSDWQATATYDQVVELVEGIRVSSPLVRVLEMGRTVEERAIPLLVIADPPVGSAAEALESERVVVFAFGNIHAGEVCGKEALLMLARELVAEETHPLLRDLVVVLAPVFNADGNERVSPDNRPGQVGPAGGMGQRPNAEGLDLNRDYVKLESPEVRALVRLLTEWDPHLTIDTHTTNGSVHRYPLTWSAPLNPSGHPAPLGFVRDELLPAVTGRLHERTGYDTFVYGNFDEARTAWRSYSARPRFGGNYRGLRGQMSILSEAYSYAPYRTRVLVTLEFVREILAYAAEHRAAIREIADRARRETAEAARRPQPDDVVGIRHRIAAGPAPLVVRTYDRADPPRPEDRTVVDLTRFEAARSVRRPHAYVIEPGHDGLVGKLREHGIRVAPFRGETVVETYVITSIERAERPFQGHRLVTLEADARVGPRPFGPGSTLVPLDQPLGTLAVYLLEPESEDGLAAWNVLDEALEVGRPYPVHRVRHPRDLPAAGAAGDATTGESRGP